MNLGVAGGTVRLAIFGRLDGVDIADWVLKEACDKRYTGNVFIAFMNYVVRFVCVLKQARGLGC